MIFEILKKSVSFSIIKRSLSDCVKLNSGYSFPLVGLGTWMSTDDQLRKSLPQAISAGFRHIDCALFYQNEPEIGRSLKKLMDDKKVKREDLFMVSKLWGNKHHPDDVEPTLKVTLADLQLKYLDLYLVHWPVCFKRGDNPYPKNDKGEMMYEPVDHLDTWKAFEKCLEKGLTKSIGVSNFNSKQLQNVLDKCTIKPAVLQIEVHPYLSQEKLVDYCKKNQIVVTAYSCLGTGGRPWAKPNDPVLLQDPVLKSLGAKHKKSTAQIILRWLNQRGIVAIPKSVTGERLKENIDVFNFQLSDSDMAEINKLNKNFRYVDVEHIYECWKPTCPDYPFNIPF